MSWRGRACRVARRTLRAGLGSEPGNTRWGMWCGAHLLGRAVAVAPRGVDARLAVLHHEVDPALDLGGVVHAARRAHLPAALQTPQRSGQRSAVCPPTPGSEGDARRRAGSWLCSLYAGRSRMLYCVGSDFDSSGRRRDGVRVLDTCLAFYTRLALAPDFIGTHKSSRFSGVGAAGPPLTPSASVSRFAQPGENTRSTNEVCTLLSFCRTFAPYRAVQLATNHLHLSRYLRVSDDRRVPSTQQTIISGYVPCSYTIHYCRPAGHQIITTCSAVCLGRL